MSKPPKKGAGGVLYTGLLYNARISFRVCTVASLSQHVQKEGALQS